MGRSVGGQQKNPKAVPHIWGGVLADNRKISRKREVGNSAEFHLSFCFIGGFILFLFYRRLYGEKRSYKNHRPVCQNV